LKDNTTTGRRHAADRCFVTFIIIVRNAHIVTGFAGICKTIAQHGGSAFLA
jgi:hypothetical protein